MRLGGLLRTRICQRAPSLASQVAGASTSLDDGMPEAGGPRGRPEEEKGGAAQSVRAAAAPRESAGGTEATFFLFPMDFFLGGLNRIPVPKLFWAHPGLLLPQPREHVFLQIKQS